MHFCTETSVTVLGYLNKCYPGHATKFHSWLPQHSNNPNTTSEMLDTSSACAQCSLNNINPSFLHQHCMHSESILHHPWWQSSAIHIKQNGLPQVVGMSLLLTVYHSSYYACTNIQVKEPCLCWFQCSVSNW